MVTFSRPVRWLLVAATMAFVAWVRIHPLTLPSAEHPADYRYRAEDGREYTYLGDYDSYLWLRHARNYLRHGTTCDAVVDGECRDTFANAPVGGHMQYARSLHIAAIAGLHRVLTFVHPGYPLPATAFWIPVLVGTLGVLPLFAIGRRLGGDLGGLVAALLASTNRVFLARSRGSDNDVWNVVLPACLVWAALRALAAGRTRTQALWATLAGAFVGLHAATWSGWTFGYLMTLFGLGAVVVVRAAQALASRGDAAIAPALRAALLVFAVFYLSAGLATTLAGSGASYFSLPTGALRQLTKPWSVVPPPSGEWISALRTVAELSRPGWSAVTALMGGAVVVFVAWMGLLALLLPLRDWRTWHFAVLIGGNFLYRYLVTTPDVPRQALVTMLALPIAAVVILDATVDKGGGEATDPSRGGRFVVVLWFLGALFVGYGAARFLLLLAAPFAVAVGIALGRLYGFLVRMSERYGPRAVRAARVGLAVVLLGCVVPVVRNATTPTLAELPQIDDAWWDTLTAIRTDTPPDTIVTTWWDYGHWSKFIAERRTSSDGSNLGTHVHHWLGRALAASDESESTGILRMLSCASEAYPLPEGRLGAYGKLIARGLEPADAYGTIVSLVRTDPPAARTLLAERGLDRAAQDDVLASTHCDPPPTRLMLNSDLTLKTSWWYLARRHPGAAKDDPTPALPRIFYRRRWTACDAAADGRYTCTLEPGVAYAYPAADPAAGRLVLPQGGSAGAATERTPALIILATADGRREVRPSGSESPDLGVLVDVPGSRILVGNPEALRSTFVSLFFLDGRGSQRFAKADEHTTEGGNRVTVWTPRW